MLGVVAARCCFILFFSTHTYAVHASVLRFLLYLPRLIQQCERIMFMLCAILTPVTVAAKPGICAYCVPACMPQRHSMDAVLGSMACFPVLVYQLVLN